MGMFWKIITKRSFDERGIIQKFAKR